MIEVSQRFHRENEKTSISEKFLAPDNVKRLVEAMQEEAALRKQTHGGRKIQTTYTVDQVYPLFKDFVQRRFRANTDLNQAFLMQNATQNLIANDVQHWRYAYYTNDRRQLTSGFGETQVAYQPWKRRLHAQQPLERPGQVRTKKIGRIDGFLNPATAKRREAAMRESRKN
tara:strand:- start:205 stop:717 length:513 start_codon:yes stop_codon:yes gene_type:complete